MITNFQDYQSYDTHKRRIDIALFYKIKQKNFEKYEYVSCNQL